MASFDKQEFFRKLDELDESLRVLKQEAAAMAERSGKWEERRRARPDIEEYINEYLRRREGNAQTPPENNG